MRRGAEMWAAILHFLFSVIVIALDCAAVILTAIFLFCIGAFFVIALCDAWKTIKAELAEAEEFKGENFL